MLCGSLSLSRHWRSLNMLTSSICTEISWLKSLASSHPNLILISSVRWIEWGVCGGSICEHGRERMRSRSAEGAACVSSTAGARSAHGGCICVHGMSALEHISAVQRSAALASQLINTAHDHIQYYNYILYPPHPAIAPNWLHTTEWAGPWSSSSTV